MPTSWQLRGNFMKNSYAPLFAIFAVPLMSAALAQSPSGDTAQQSGPLNIAPRISTKGLKHPSNDSRNVEGIWKSVFQPPAIDSAIGTSGAARPIDGGPLPLLPEGEKIYRHRIEMEQKGTPVVPTGGTCRPGLPHRVFPLYLGSFEILQAEDRLVIFPASGTIPWTIYMNRQHPKNLPPTYVGHSVGHWEGQTLVVDSYGFNTLTWLDPIGAPHSDKLRIITRIDKIELNGGTALRVMMTTDDPVMYSRPWTQAFTIEYRPDARFYEVYCLENTRPENNENMIYEDVKRVPGVNSP